MKQAEIHSTTILSVRRGASVVIAGDGQVTLAALADRCETLFGGAQEPELAFAGARLDVLQARPNTR